MMDVVILLAAALLGNRVARKRPVLGWSLCAAALAYVVVA